MTEILCNWLNNDLGVSRKIEPSNFAREFSSGYLVGEVLARYQLQNDFDQFSQNRTADSKLNNFTRLEPVLHLLEIPFDTNVARDIMTERHGIATRLMYQLFIALNKKQKSNLTGVAMETMRAAAPAKLEAVESVIYRERLKLMLPRQTDLDLNALMARFHQHQIALEQTAFRERFEEQQRTEARLQNERQELIQQHREGRARKQEMLAKIRAARVYVPKPPKASTNEHHLRKKQQEAEAVKEEIDKFEERLKRIVPPSKALDSMTESGTCPQGDDLMKTSSSNEEYINRIRTGLTEDQVARKERAKRRRKVLVDQMQAHEAQENAHREEMLVGRLLRQSQQERRIAVQLLQTRREKDAVRRNRQNHAAQCEKIRRKQLDDALNREAEMARLAKLEYIEQRSRDLQLHDELRAERAQMKYRKHYDICRTILSDIVDVATRVAEYRGFTNKLLPAKLMRDWQALFVNALPIYDVPGAEADAQQVSVDAVLEHERQQLLNETDFTEYRSMTGQWQPPESNEITITPPGNNPIVGHIVQRLHDMVYPSGEAPNAPQFSPYPVKACVLGKAFSGKTTAIQSLLANHCLTVLQIDKLVEEAIQAYNDNEVVEVQVEEPPVEEEKAGILPADDNKAGILIQEHSPSIDMPPTDTVTVPAAATGGETGEAVTNEPAADAPATEKIPQEGEQPGGATPAETEEEKTDPEKPVTDETDDVDEMQTKPSVRAELGFAAQSLLQTGKQLNDDLLVNIVVDAIRQVPEGSGWLLDGFPTTPAQAAFLEKALTGYEATKKKGRSPTRKPRLAVDPKPAPPTPEAASGIDVVILLDVSNEICLRRAAGRTRHSQTDEFYQAEFHPPPEGGVTGIGTQDQLVPVDDPTHDQDKIQQRLMIFDEVWPQMEKWFNKFGILKTVDASSPEETLALDVELILDETIQMVHHQGIVQSLPQETDTIKVNVEETPKPASEKAPEEEPAVKTPEKGSPLEAKKEAKTSPSGDRRSGKSPATRASSTGKKSAAADSGGSAKSKKRGRSGKKRGTPTPEPEEAPPSTPPPQPGSAEWQYVEHPIDQELASVMVRQWDVMENTYVNSSKHVFQCQRAENDIIIHYFHQIREDFLEFLRRPDSKQEFLIQWQEEFNDIAADVRNDPETRAELHQRVDDIRERLWSVCDARRDQAQQERERLANDGWLDDRLGLLVNEHIALIQVELDRFHDTARMLRDYYRALDMPIPDAPDTAVEYARVPLVELPPMEPPPEPASEEPPTAEEGEQVERVVTDMEPPLVQESEMKTTVSKQAVDLPRTESRRIPLLPRRPISPEAVPAPTKSKEKSKGKGVPKDLCEECRLPVPTDLDEKLIYDTYVQAMGSLDSVISAEQAAREEEEEAERERDANLEAEKSKSGKKGKKSGKKSRSPSAKKGKGKEAPRELATPKTAEMEEEEKVKRQLKERAVQEFFGALREEAAATRMRIELIVVVCSALIRDLRAKAECVFSDMDDWLGARFLKEMQSIDLMSEVMRQAVESGTQIKEQLIFDEGDFLLDENMLVLDDKNARMVKSAAASPAPSVIEEPAADSCTIDQMHKLYEQFRLTAPEGLISQKAFQEILLDLVNVTSDSSPLPELWMTTLPEKIDLLTSEMSVDGDIDWRSFLLFVALPWPQPSQQELLDTLQTFCEMDQQMTGFVSRQQYDRMDLWFAVGPQTTTPDSATAEARTFDRMSAIKDLFFTIFSDDTDERLAYVNMLLYFASSYDPYIGFLRALSVAVGSHIPHLPKRTAIQRSDSASQHSVALSLDMDAEKMMASEPMHEDRVVEDIPSLAFSTKVPIEALDLVVQKARGMRVTDSYRFNVTCDTNDIFSKERLIGVYQDVGSENCEPVLFTILIEHPVIQDIIALCNIYRNVDVKGILSITQPDILDSSSLKPTAE